MVEQRFVSGGGFGVTPFLGFGSGGETSLVTRPVPVEVLKCACGSMFFPRGSEVSSTLGSSLNINNSIDLDLRHVVDVTVKDEQIFKTVSTTISTGSNVFPEYIRLKFADHYKELENRITIEGSVKITIKTKNGKIIAIKYINDFLESTTLENAEVVFQQSNIIEKVNINNEFLLVEVESICDRTDPTRCDFLPTSMSIEPICTNLCMSYIYLACLPPDLEYVPTTALEEGY